MKIENVKLVEGKFAGTLKIKDFEVPVEIVVDFKRLPHKGLPFKLEHE